VEGGSAAMRSSRRAASELFNSLLVQSILSPDPQVREFLLPPRHHLLLLHVTRPSGPVCGAIWTPINAPCSLMTAPAALGSPGDAPTRALDVDFAPRDGVIKLVTNIVAHNVCLNVGKHRVWTRSPAAEQICARSQLIARE